MNKLTSDSANIEKLLNQFIAYAEKFLRDQPTRKATMGSSISPPKGYSDRDYPSDGLGTEQALKVFLDQFSTYLSSSAGPNYFGFVTGGTTPASLIGDWLTALFDQNAMGSNDSIAPLIEAQAISLFRKLVGLSNAFDGTFVTGATMSSFVGLATARQWVGERQNQDIAQQGLYGMEPVKVFSGTPHSSIYKGLSMAGLGRDNLSTIATEKNRECIDVAKLEQALSDHNKPCIVVANLGTVNTVDFDDLRAIVRLKKRYEFWLHVDAAFGGIAACSEQYAHYCDGLQNADSITVDAHKWLNVPYDCAVQLTQHLSIQRKVFQNSAAYLESHHSVTNFVDLTPENSRRLRALSVWMTLVAYGKQGYAEIVNRNVKCAQQFGALIASSPHFELMAPVRLNGVCFTLSKAPVDGGADCADWTDKLQRRIKSLTELIVNDGTFFLTPTVFQGRAALRLSVSNWQTQSEHVHACFDKLTQLVEQLD